MTKFRITYKNGKTEDVHTDAETVADQINRTFGMSVEEADDFGVGAEILPSDEELEKQHQASLSTSLSTAASLSTSASLSTVASHLASLSTSESLSTSLSTTSLSTAVSEVASLSTSASVSTGKSGKAAKAASLSTSISTALSGTHGVSEASKGADNT